MQAALIAIVTDTSAPVRAVAKYRPPQAIVVVTTRSHVAKQCNLSYGCVPLLLRGGKMAKDEEHVIQQVKTHLRCKSRKTHQESGPAVGI